MDEYTLRKNRMFQTACRMNGVMIIIIAVVFTIFYFATQGVVHGVQFIMLILPLGLIIFLISRTKISEHIRGLMEMCILFGSLLIFCSPKGYGKDDYFLLVAPLIFSMIYFDTMILRMYSVISCMAFFIVALIVPGDLFFIKDNTYDVIICFAIYIVCCIYFYFITVWFDQNLKKSSMHMKRNTQLNESIRKNISVVEQVEQRLEKDVYGCDETLDKSMDSIQNITASVEGMSQSVQQNADSIDEVNREMINSIDKLEELGTTVTRLSNQSNNMTDQVAKSCEQMESLSGHMKNVEGVVINTSYAVEELERMLLSIQQLLEGISSISNETNLLSLNASIEAARVGEHGKGFSVVAEQVRVLAEQSGKVVSNISEITSNINKKINVLLNQTEEGNQAVKMGTQLVEKVYEKFMNMKRSYDKINKEVLQITKSINEINHGFEIIGNEVMNMSGMAQENAAATQELLASMEEQNGHNLKIKIAMDSIVKQNEHLKKTVFSD